MKNDNGHFTIDEQNEYLRVYNHSNGKYYKLLMEEIENWLWIIKTYKYNYDEKVKKYL